MDVGHYKKAIMSRLAELGGRIHDIDEELGHAKPKDLEEQAVDIEDDEVLEGLGIAAQNEIAQLKQALLRIQDHTYGICLSCDEQISEARLNAVLHASVCKNCAKAV